MITTEIRSGEVFADRYRVIRRLGAGGMATVWLAEDERLGREVAIKRLKTDAPEESLTRFRREARLGAALHHPNFASVFDTIKSDEGALIVMEYVPGQSLEELIHAGPMEPERAVSILRGVAAALDHAHESGVVHRDIKPANILVREDGAVKLADLGIARAEDATQITAEGKVIGTLPYMAPERLRGAASGEPAGDIYSLAAVAYELLSGTRLDRDGSPGDPPDRSALATGWPNASAAAFAVVMRGLSADPRQRQRTAGEFVEELDRALGREEEETQPFEPLPPRERVRPASTPPQPTRSRGSRSGAMVVLALLAVAGLMAAGIGLLGGGSGDGTDPKKERVAADGDRSSGEAAPAAADGPAAATPAEDQEASSSPAADGASLNAQGFSLIQQGRAAEAVPILRQAVAAFPEGSTDLDYAYALYNLGSALRVSGHPEEAIDVLERRLEIPNQRGTVAAELARARAEAAAPE